MKNNPSPANATSADTELLFRCQAMLGESVESEEPLELAMQLLAQELLTKKLQGQSICDNLKLLDRLMRYASLKLRLTNQRLREQKGAAKSATTKARLEKLSRLSTITPATSSILPEERPSEIVAPKMVKFSSCATKGSNPRRIGSPPGGWEPRGISD